MDDDSIRRPRVVILGGGFAGVGAATRLVASPVDVVLIDRNHYNTFQPLLYHLATGMLEPGAVGHSLRRLIAHRENTAVHQGTVRSVDIDARSVHLDHQPPIDYDYLVFALGVDVDFLATKGARDHAFAIHTLPDALHLRRHLTARWAIADRSPAQVADGALNVVVAGGGPTGVEVAGAVAELYRHRFAQEHPQITLCDARVLLIEKDARLLPEYAPTMRAFAARALVERAVDVITGQAVVSVSPTRVVLASGERIRAHTLIWCGGVRGTPVAQTIGTALGDTGRITTGATLDLPGHPEVFAVGDAAAIHPSASQAPLPQFGTLALQSGQHAGDSIARMIAAAPPRPFEYRDHGPMVRIGRGAAGVQLPDGQAMTGRQAQLAWLAVQMGLLHPNEHADHPTA